MEFDASPTKVQEEMSALLNEFCLPGPPNVPKTTAHVPLILGIEAFVLGT